MPLLPSEAALVPLSRQHSPGNPGSALLRVPKHPYKGLSQISTYQTRGCSFERYLTPRAGASKVGNTGSHTSQAGVTKATCMVAYPHQ